MSTIHATCLLVGEDGVLIRGASGSGKSTLAREILTLAASQNRFCRLVADDRVAVEARHGRLIARSVALVAGLLEIRGIGLVPHPYAPAARVALVVDCDWGEPERLPAPAVATIAGIALPRLAGRAGSLLAGVVLARIGDAAATGGGVQ